MARHAARLVYRLLPPSQMMRFSAPSVARFRAFLFQLSMDDIIFRHTSIIQLDFARISPFAILRFFSFDGTLLSQAFSQLSHAIFSTPASSAGFLPMTVSRFSFHRYFLFLLSRHFASLHAASCLISLFTPTISSSPATPTGRPTSRHIDGIS